MKGESAVTMLLSRATIDVHGTRWGHTQGIGVGGPLVISSAPLPVA